MGNGTYKRGREGGDPEKDARILAAIEREGDEARRHERASIVAWLRRQTNYFSNRHAQDLADKIESGAHDEPLPPPAYDEGRCTEAGCYFCRGSGDWTKCPNVSAADNMSDTGGGK